MKIKLNKISSWANPWRHLLRFGKEKAEKVKDGVDENDEL